MRSIKRGRGPSMMGGIAEVGAAVFGVIWTLFALEMGAPPLFAAFGVVFVIMAVAGAVYQFSNATAKKRHSLFDIVEDEEEPDPLNERFSDVGGKRYAYCPACGERLEQTDRFCSRCGRKIEKE